MRPCSGPNESRKVIAMTLSTGRTIPASWYFDPAIYEQEKARVFRDAWWLTANLHDFAADGSFVTRHLAGEPVLLLREAGEVRAMSNVCRHRATTLCRQEAGIVGKLRCRYHGWTYDLQGKLLGTPEWDGVEDFRKENHCLPRFGVEATPPFLWVSLSARERLQLPFPVEAGWRFRERREYDLRCNWKVYVDNYLDGGYHVNTIHPQLAGMLDYSQYATNVVGSAVLQVSPATGGIRAGTASFWWLWPNVMINTYADVMDTNTVYPTGPESCRVVFDFYFRGQDDVFQDASLACADRVQEEDRLICEDVQVGVHSFTYDRGRYSVKREIGVYTFHRMLERALATSR